MLFNRNYRSSTNDTNEEDAINGILLNLMLEENVLAPSPPPPPHLAVSLSLFFSIIFKGFSGLAREHTYYLRVIFFLARISHLFLHESIRSYHSVGRNKFQVKPVDSIVNMHTRLKV